MDAASTSGTCGNCGASLGEAEIREVRHYEGTRLMAVTCAMCEQTFFAVHVEPSRAISTEDVVGAARALARATSLSQLFDLG